MANQRINFNQYNELLNKYNNTLTGYREALQSDDSYTIRQKYQDLAKTSEKLKAEFTRIEPYLQAIKDEYNKLKNASDESYERYYKLVDQYQKDQSEDNSQEVYNAQRIKDESNIKFKLFKTETGFDKLRSENNKLMAEHKEMRIHYNETRSEGDLITIDQRKQDAAVDNEIGAIFEQFNSLESIGISNNINQEIQTVENYTGHLNDSELETRVLDDHAFYRLITSKQFSNSQFNKIYQEVSENLAKKPMTVIEIIKFCTDNGIPHFTDDEFRSLIKNENKDYENTNQSVRNIDKYGYIEKNSEISVSFENAGSKYSNDYKNISTIVDADSFYKFIDTKMVRGEYTHKQYNKLYVEISEKLVHSSLTKDEINQIYNQYNITPIKEGEWNKLIIKQETRRDIDNIANKSGNLEFQGSVNIEFKDQNFKFKVDLYHNDQPKYGTSGTQDESKAKLQGKPANGSIENNQEFQLDIDNIQNVLLEATKAFNESFGIRKSGDVTNFRVFIFDNDKDYLQYAAEARGHATTSDNGNIANVYMFFGKNNYQDPNDLLQHEFAHALTFQATSKLGLSRTFMEGIAEYIVGKVDGKSNADFAKLVPARNFDKSIEKIMKYTEYENDHYHTGAAIVAYLEETQPNFLDNLLYAANDAIKNDKHIDVMEMMHKFFQEQQNKPIKAIDWFKNKIDYNQSADDHADNHGHNNGGYSGPPSQHKSFNDKQGDQSVAYAQPWQSDQSVVNKQEAYTQFNSYRDYNMQYDNSKNNQFSNKNAEFKQAINKGDIIIYKVKGDSLSDTTFEMIKRSKVANANNEYEKNVTLNSEKFDINNVVHQEGVKSGGQLFYVLNKNYPDKSGFYNFGQDKFKFSAKYLEDPKFKYNYHDNDHLGNMLLSLSNPSNDINVGSTPRDIPVGYALHDEQYDKKQDQYKENDITQNVVQPEAQKPVMLNFKIERDDPIDQYHFSARIKLAENSKNLLRDTLGDSTQFNNLDNYFNLNHNFYIYYNNGAYRDELYIKNGKHDMLISNLPLDSYTFKVSFNGSSIVNYGFYSTSNGMQVKNFDSNGKLLPTIEHVLNNLLSNTNIHTARDTLARASSELAVREMKAEEEKRYAKEEFNKKNEELKELIDKGEVILFKVIKGESIKGESIKDERSIAVLRLTEHGGKALNKYVEDVVLDQELFYIDKSGNIHDIKGDAYFKYDLCFVLNKSSYPNLKDGFYSAAAINSNIPAWYLNDYSKSSAAIDEKSHQKLLSNLESNNSKQQYAYMINDEQMLSDQPQIKKASSNAIKQEEVVLKDTILTIGKSDTPDEHGRYKAEIKIEYDDIKFLYDNASEAEKDYVVKFWHVLAKNNYKIGDLPVQQYYFKDGNFVIHDSQRQCIKLPENAISLKLMNLDGNLELVVLNKEDGQVIGNIHEVNNLNYGLLSNSSTLNHLETHKIQDDIHFTEHQSDYDTYLINGLGGQILGDHNDHIW